MFLDEISKLTGLPINETFSEYKLINIGGKVLYVQNYLKLLVYNKNQIVLKIKSNEINVEGESLKILELESNSILIKGNIFKVYLSKEVSYEKSK